ncbi:MAG: LexA family transcriptional regulator [Bacteroidetes bacterium]|nr:LexA family transcriptional regulator [Bacteroidota bacterium]MBX7047265.1 XRE family transcriptional regulator [Ignavibacteria bacterium]
MIQTRLKQLREALGLNKNQLAVRLGVDNGYLSRYENGKVKPNSDFYERLVQKFENVNLSWLISGEGEMFIQKISAPERSKIRSVPLYSYVYCGSPASQWDNDKVKEHLFLPSLTKFGEVFGLIAKGDSMAPYINPYDVLICVDKPDLLKDGTAVVCVFKSVDTIEANAKLLKRNRKNGTVMLYSINTKYEPEVYNEDEILKIYKVVRIIRDVK